MFTKAVVTGASSGIGESLARIFAKQGIALILTGRDTQRLGSLAQELRQQVAVTTVSYDLVNPEHLAQFIEMIQKEVPDLIVNNAGAGVYGEVLTYDLSDNMKIYDLNATVPFKISIEAARSLITAGKKGTILNVSSSAAFQVFPHFAVYSAAKAFIKDFSESFDCEVCDKGVRILTSCPGVVATRFQERAVIDASILQERHMVMTADFAAQDMWKQIQKGQAVRVFNWRYRIMTFLSRHLTPKWLLLWIIHSFFVGQLPPRPFIKAPSHDNV